MDTAAHTTTMLPVMEHFYTVQGEGAYSGVPAYFIRLGGCDVGCFWCDVKDSWDAEKHPKYTIPQIVEWVTATAAPIAVITGGEPLMHNLDALTQALQAKGIRTHIETSGAHPFSGSWDWVTFSPKKFKEPHPSVFDKADELKIIAYNKHDFEWAQQYQDKVPQKCTLYIQPEWDKSKTMLPLIVDFVKNHPLWRISLQTHKFMDIP